MRLCTENARKIFNKKVGQSVVVRHRAQPNKCKRRLVITPDRPFLYLFLSAPTLFFPAPLPMHMLSSVLASASVVIPVPLLPPRLAGAVSIGHGGTFWQHLTEITPAAPRYQNLAKQTPSYPHRIGFVSPHCLPYHLSVMFVSLFALVYGFLLFL